MSSWLEPVLNMLLVSIRPLKFYGHKWPLQRNQHTGEHIQKMFEWWGFGIHNVDSSNRETLINNNNNKKLRLEIYDNLKSRPIQSYIVLPGGNTMLIHQQRGTH